MAKRTFTRFDSMTFPDYDYREYPKMVYVPRKLPAGLPSPDETEEGAKRFDANGYLLATFKAGEWRAEPLGITVHNEAEEREAFARGKPGSAAEEERVKLMHRATEMGITFDKRWGVDRLKMAVESAAA